MALFRAPFSIVFYVLLPPNCEAYGISPRFRQSGPSSPRSWSVSSFVFFVILFLVAASCRILYSCDPVCFSNLKPSCVLLCDLLYFIFNTIQCGVCHRVAKKIVCESFLGNILFCIDREAFPIVPVITYHHHHHRWSLVTFRSVLSCSSCCPARIIPFAVFVNFLSAGSLRQSESSL